MGVPSTRRSLAAVTTFPHRSSSSGHGTQAARAKIDSTVPNSARIWNYWLGGKDHYPVDREAGDAYRELYPGIVATALAVRHFLARAVRTLAGESGVCQFLDIGAGLPAADNTHEIAQKINPAARIVYVDNDALVLAHARALLTSGPEGVCDCVDADMRDPGKIISAAGRTLDLDQPVAVMFLGVLGHIRDDDQAQHIVRDVMAPLAPGSCLVLADSINVGRAHLTAQDNYAATGADPYRLQSPSQIGGFFDGLKLLPPGVVSVETWRPDPCPSPPAHVDTLAGVGRKPRTRGRSGG